MPALTPRQPPLYSVMPAWRPAESELRVINTERHLDHMLGNCYFEDRKVPIYGHPERAAQPVGPGFGD